MRIIVPLALVLMVIGTSIADAQLFSPPTPTAAECSRAAAEWNAAQRSKDFPFASGMIAYCGAFGDSVLANALRRSVNESDTAHLHDLLSDAIQHRAPLLLAAAEAVAVNRNATLQARVTALLVVLGQYQPAMGFPPSVGYAELLGPTWPGCRVTSYNDTPPPGPPQSPPMLRAVAKVLDSMSIAQSEPEQIRNLAKCVRRAYGMDVPQSAEPPEVQLTYLCDTRFTVHNSSMYDAELEYNVPAAHDSGGTSVWPGVTDTLIADGRGAMTIWVSGQFTATAGATYVACK